MTQEAIAEIETEVIPLAEDESQSVDAGQPEEAEVIALDDGTEKPTEDAGEPEVKEVEGDGDLVITIGDEEPEQQDKNDAPGWVRDLRKDQRRLAKENRELKDKLKKNDEPEKTVLGDKPTLEGHNFDTEKYETALTSWHDDKRKYDDEQADKEDLKVEEQKAWQGRLDNYGSQRDELAVKDFEDAEADVTNVLSQTQQGIILQGADNSARVIYALGKHPAKAKELAAITDPVKFTFEVAKLEAKLKVTSRKPATTPEKKVIGSSTITGSADSNLDKLRAEAQKTGDFTKVTAYKRKIRNSK